MTKLIDSLFDPSVGGLQKAMDLTWRRNQALISNVTNAETPMYRAIDVNFAGELEAAFGNKNDSLLRTSENHLDITTSGMAHTVADFTSPTKPDGNNVDMDIQMARMVQNSGDFMNAAKLIKRQIGLLKTAIRTGER